MKACIQTYTSFSRLSESCHHMSTQTNESLNNSIARFCPKHKHLSNTTTLLTRVSVVVAIKNMGFEQFYYKILSSISGSDLVTCYPALQRIGKKRREDVIRKSDVEVKKKRSHAHDVKSKQTILNDRLTKKKGDYFQGAAFTI